MGDAEHSVGEVVRSTSAIVREVRVWSDDVTFPHAQCATQHYYIASRNNLNNRERSAPVPEECKCNEDVDFGAHIEGDIPDGIGKT